MIATRGGENPEAVFHPSGVDEGVLGARRGRSNNRLFASRASVEGSARPTLPSSPSG